MTSARTRQSIEKRIRMTDEPVDSVQAKDLHCPNCGEKLSFEMVGKLMADSRMSFCIAPHEGELLSAKTVGKSLAALEGIFVACGDELGVKTQMLVEGMTFDKGAVKFNLLLARHDPGL
jgi:hypothetical protein